MGGGGGGVEGGRSRSENEGLDTFADGLYEIESGDVRDGEYKLIVALKSNYIYTCVAEGESVLST